MPTVDNHELEELVADVEFYAGAILQAAQAQVNKPPAVIKLHSVKRLADGLGELYDELKLDGLLVQTTGR